MKKLAILCSFLFLAGSAWAESAPETVDATIVADVDVAAEPTAGSGCADAPSLESGLPSALVQTAARSRDGGTDSLATCTATCNNGGTISCSGSSCSAVDSNCPNQRGYVRCDGSTQYCASCPSTPTCNQGAPCGPGVGKCLGTCYAGSCRCYCTMNQPCSQNSHCAGDGVCLSGSCVCY